MKQRLHVFVVATMFCLLLLSMGLLFFGEKEKFTHRDFADRKATMTAMTAATNLSMQTGSSTPFHSDVLPHVRQVVKCMSTAFHSSPRRMLWGAYTVDTPSSAPTFETLVGRPMDLQPIFVGWRDTFPFEYATSVRGQGKTFVIFWEQHDVTLDDIVNGNSDAVIREFAARAAEYEGPIILAPFHEMNGNWEPWGGVVGDNTPQKVVAAWKHVHGFFNGVRNVKFAWTVNSGSVPDIPENAISQYYPGDAYVDYVAVDGFNDGNPWHTFGSIFNGILSELKSYEKPIYILSMASAEGERKAEWITDAFTVQLPKHPEVVGWIWFNANKEANWLVDSDPNALLAFKAVLSK